MVSSDSSIGGPDKQQHKRNVQTDTFAVYAFFDYHTITVILS